MGEETVNKEGGWPKRRNNRNRLDRRLFGSGGEGQRRVGSRTRPVLAFSRLVTVSRLWGAMEGDGLDGLRRHHTDSLYLSLSLSLRASNRAFARRFANVSSPSVRRISRAPIRDSRCVLVSFRGCTETDGAAIQASGPYDSLRFEYRSWKLFSLYLSISISLSLSLVAPI